MIASPGVFGKVGRSYKPDDQISADLEAKLLQVMAYTEAYKAGRTTNQTKGWHPPHRSGDSAIYSSWDRVTPRIRDMIRNEPGLRKASLVLRRLIVGTGIQTFSNASDAVEILWPDDKDLLRTAQRFEEETDYLFKRWADKQADATHERSFWDLQGEFFRETCDTGNGFMMFRRLKGADRLVPLALQPIPAEQLDRSKDRSGSEGINKIVGGIEYDWQTNRPVAYHVYDAHPYDDFSATAGGNTQRIPANRMMHWFPVKDDVSANSGISWFVAICLASRDIDWYLGNELTSAAIAALLTLVHKTDQPWKKLGLEEEVEALLGENASPPVRMGHANLAVIGTKDEIEVVQSDRPNANAEAFISLMQRLEAQGIDLSYIRFTSDYKATSYTAARAAHLDDDGMVKPLQNSLAVTVNDRVRVEFQRQAVGLGLVRSITPAQYRRYQFLFEDFDQLPAGREQLDPVKETDASVSKLRAALSTLKIECGKRGLNWKSVLRQMRKEKALADEFGLALDFSKGNGGNLQTEGQAEPAKSDEEDSEDDE